MIGNMLGTIHIYTLKLGEKEVKFCTKEKMYEWILETWFEVSKFFESPEFVLYAIKEEDFTAVMPGDMGANHSRWKLQDKDNNRWEFNPYKKMWEHYINMNEFVEYIPLQLEKIA